MDTIVTNQLSLTTLDEVLVPPDRKMTDSGRFINPGITSRAKYDHISIVLSIPVDTGRVEAAGVTLRHLPKKRFIFPDISIYRTDNAQIFIYDDFFTVSGRTTI